MMFLMPTHSLAKRSASWLKQKKNRDADFFVCNLFNNKKRLTQKKKITETLSTKSKCLTHNHHDVLICKNVFISSIKNGEFELAGYCGYELYLFHRPYFWKCLQEMSNEIGNNNIKKRFLLCATLTWLRTKNQI